MVKSEQPKRKIKMPAQHSNSKDVNLELAKEVRKLSQNIRDLESEKIWNLVKSPWKLMWYSFLKGIMVGFGGVIGATVVVAIFIFLISQIEFVPIIGDWVKQIVEQVKNGGM